MSWGPGIMPDPVKEPPSAFDSLKAAYDVNQKSDDPAATEGYRYPWPRK